MQSEKTSLFRIMKRKPIMVEILNFLDLKDIARSFLICKYWRQQSRGCIADYNSRVVINTQDFDEDFECLLNFINWTT